MMRKSKLPEDNISMFDIEDENGVKAARVNKLDIVKFDYLCVESLRTLMTLHQVVSIK